jgi:hypothetical protein
MEELGERVRHFERNDEERDREREDGVGEALDPGHFAAAPAETSGPTRAGPDEALSKETGHGHMLAAVIRKLASGGYRLYSRKKDPKTGRRRNLGTFRTREAAARHERAVQFFKKK